MLHRRESQENLEIINGVIDREDQFAVMEPLQDEEYVLI